MLEAYCFCPVRPSVRVSVRLCVCLERLLTRYLAEYLTHFHQTYINDALWDRDERFTIWGQKVKDHGGVSPNLRQLCIMGQR